MKKSLRQGSGYLIIDHSESPGIKPEEVPLALRGKIPIVSGGEIYERDIQICTHCGRQVVLNPNRVAPRSFCAKCDHYICDDPICNKTCSPIKKLLDVNQSRLEHGKDVQIILTDA